MTDNFPKENLTDFIIGRACRAWMVGVFLIGTVGLIANNDGLTWSTFASRPFYFIFMALYVYFMGLGISSPIFFLSTLLAVILQKQLIRYPLLFCILFPIFISVAMTCMILPSSFKEFFLGTILVLFFLIPSSQMMYSSLKKRKKLMDEKLKEIDIVV